MGKISVIHDPWEILEKASAMISLPIPDVLVNDDKSFISAVREIERVKRREISGLSIHLLVNKYLRLLNASTWGDGLIEVVSLEPIMLLEQVTKMVIRRDTFSAVDLLGLGLLCADVVNVAEKVVGFGDTFFDPFQLLVLLKTTGDISVIDRNLPPTHRLAKIALHLPSLESTGCVSLNRTVISYVKALSDACDFPFPRALAELIEDAITSSQATCLYESLLIHCLLKNYPKIGRDLVCQKAVGTDKFTIVDIDGLTTLISPSLDGLLDRVSIDLALRINSALNKVFPDVVETIAGYLPPIDRVIVMLGKVSGYFEAEYRFLVSLICENESSSNLDDLRVLLSKLIRCFGPLLEKDKRLRQDTTYLEQILCVKSMLRNQRPSTTSPFSQWSKYYRECQLLMDEVSTDIQNVNTLLPKNYVSSIRDEIAEARVLCNTDYSHWFISNFPNILRQSYRHLPKTVLSVTSEVKKHSVGKHRVIMWVIDAMCWDHWNVLHGLLANRGLSLVSPVAELVSMIPSSTLISRRALFGGKTLSALLVQHQQTGISPHNEALSLGRALGLDVTKAKTEYLDPESLVDEGDGRRITRIGQDLVYVLGGPGEFIQVLESKSKFTALVTSDVDGLWHSVMAGTSTVKKSVRHILEEIVDAIIPYVTDEVYLVVATDHGTVSANWSSSVCLPKDLTALNDCNQVEVHPRYVVVTTDKKNHLQSQPQDTGWHYIGRSSLNDYGLPTTLKVKTDCIKDVDFYAFPSSLDYVGKSGVYMHGGTSYYETIIPCAVLTRTQPSLKDPTISINGDVIAKQSCRISLKVLNPADHIIQDVRVTIPEFEVFDLLLGDIESESHKLLSISVNVDSVSKLECTATIDFSSVHGHKVVMNTFLIDVKPGISSSVSRMALRKER